MISPAATRTFLALLAVGAALPAQRQAETPASPLYLGWIAEHLHRDRDAARAHYRRSLEHPTENDERRAVAAARLVELDRIAGDRAAVERHLAALEAARGISLSGLDVHELPREALQQAIELPPGPARDAAVEQARQALLDAANSRDMPGQGFGLVWWTVRSIANSRDEARQRLERELATARASGDHQRVRELAERLRQPRGSAREADVDRARVWRVKVARLIVEGRFDLAGLLLARFPAPPSKAAPKQRLAQALARTDLHPLERSALEALSAQIDAWHAAGRPEAARALALLPY